jgi:acyl carrier protein
VAGIISSLLGLPQVGLNDNFFYLGGNSLFGTQVIARLRDAFQVELPLLTLFDHPTVADLAAEVERLMVANLDAMSEEEAQRLLALNSPQANL